MNAKDFIHLLKYPQEIEQNHTDVLKYIIDEYPYFQVVRAVYLRGLKNEDSFKYNSELKIAAAYTTDRTILFDFITSAVFTQSKTKKVYRKEAHQQVSNKVISENIFVVEEELSIGKPIIFKGNESHSFNEWLQLSTSKKIEREDEKTFQKTSNTVLIDDFIEKSPKISRVDKYTEYKIKISENISDSYLMTETLAKVYLEQKKYENAIKAYEILSFKYPKKSGFFADQIKKIRNLQKSKL